MTTHNEGDPEHLRDELNPSTECDLTEDNDQIEVTEKEPPVIVKVESYRWVILVSYIGLNGVISLG
jgi:hypothetical protein